MNPVVILFTVVVALNAAFAQAGRIFLLDEDDLAHVRYRRDAVETSALPLQHRSLPFAPPHPVHAAPPVAVVPPVVDLIPEGSAYGHGHPVGRVGPVYTFVRTDPYAHFKYGVRHVVGRKYAGHH